MFLRNIPKSHAFVMGVGWGEELHYVLYYGIIMIYYGFKFNSQLFPSSSVSVEAKNVI